MAKILNAEKGKHIVQKYSFKNLFDEEIEENKDDEVDKEELKDSDNIEIEIEKEPISTPSSIPYNNDLIEQLLKKSDEFANSIIRLEQQLSKQTEDCNKQLSEMKENSYKLGFNEGYNKAKEENETLIKEQLSRLIEGVHKIEEVYKEYQNKAENIEKELAGIAVDIAEEVIAKELSKSSKEIALSLTKELINDIKEATKIEIKVNPLDYDYIKDNLNLEKIKITPDNAVSLGGVLIISDAGNIEGEIKERFQTIKNHILKG